MQIMFQCNIENMPVIENGQALGIITLKHLADSSFSVAETGGKKGFIHNVSGKTAFIYDCVHSYAFTRKERHPRRYQTASQR